MSFEELIQQKMMASFFGTYRGQPRTGYETLSIGIQTYRDPRPVSWVHGMLRLPFIGKISSDAIIRNQRNNENEQ